MQFIKKIIKSIFQAMGLEIQRRKNQSNKKPDYYLEEVTLDQVDPVFEPNEFGTRLDTQVLFVGRSSLYATGATNDSESWILSVLAKKAKNMFEFGTCTGRTTYHLAVNSDQQAIVTTLTMPPLKKSDYRENPKDDPNDKRRALLESNFEKFFYTETAVESKIHQLFSDSKQFDETDYVDKCDLIFIDGSHAYSYVKSDTQKALRMLKSGGIILWHDYGNNVKGVAQYLHELYNTMPLKRICRTFLAFYVKD